MTNPIIMFFTLRRLFKYAAERAKPNQIAECRRSPNADDLYIYGPRAQNSNVGVLSEVTQLQPEKSCSIETAYRPFCRVVGFQGNFMNYIPPLIK